VLANFVSMGKRKREKKERDASVRWRKGKRRRDQVALENKELGEGKKRNIALLPRLCNEVSRGRGEGVASAIVCGWPCKRGGKEGEYILG